MSVETTLQHRPRIHTLDSLRGIAALCVVIGHITGGTLIADQIYFTPLYFFRAGREAVILFFMLSGYVLVYQYGLKPGFNYRNFIGMRFFRIYLPYIASTVLSLALLKASTTTAASRVFISQQWHYPLNIDTLLAHLFLIGNFNSAALNAVIWTLTIEMRISIIFPVILYFLDVRPVKLAIVLLVTTIASALALVASSMKFDSYYNGYIDTVYYLWIFIAGGLIAKHQQMLVNWYKNLSHKIKWAIPLAAFICYTYAHTVTLAIANQIYIPGLVRSRFLWEDTIVATAAIFFIIAAIAVYNQNTFLSAKPFLFLGKISYSLYLVHLPVICFVYFSLNGKMSLAAVLAIGFVCAIIIAIIYNRVIEKPAIKLGKQVINYRNHGSNYH